MLSWQAVFPADCILLLFRPFTHVVCRCRLVAIFPAVISRVSILEAPRPCPALSTTCFSRLLLTLQTFILIVSQVRALFRPPFLFVRSRPPPPPLTNAATEVHDIRFTLSLSPHCYSLSPHRPCSVETRARKSGMLFFFLLYLSALCDPPSHLLHPPLLLPTVRRR